MPEHEKREYDFEKMKKDAEPFIKFEKDVKNRIAYITFDRPDAQNSTTMGMRQNYADLIHKCNVDDDVKVVVIRGEGEDFGSGGDLPEQRDMLENPGMPLLHELAINDENVTYPRRLLPLPVHGDRLLREGPGR